MLNYECSLPGLMVLLPSSYGVFILRYRLSNNTDPLMLDLVLNTPEQPQTPVVSPPVFPSEVSTTTPHETSISILDHTLSQRSTSSRVLRQLR